MLKYISQFLWSRNFLAHLLCVVLAQKLRQQNRKQWKYVQIVSKPYHGSVIDYFWGEIRVARWCCKRSQELNSINQKINRCHKEKPINNLIDRYGKSKCIKSLTRLWMISKIMPNNLRLLEHVDHQTQTTLRWFLSKLEKTQTLMWQLQV